MKEPDLVALFRVSWLIVVFFHVYHQMIRYALRD